MTEPGLRKNLEKISPSGCACSASAISVSSSEICSTITDRGVRQAKHDRASRTGLDLPGATGGRGPQPRKQLPRGLVTAVAVGLEKRAQALLAQPTRILRARVALQERERDPTVKGGEQADRARPEPLQLRAQLVGQRYPRGHEILPRPGSAP